MLGISPEWWILYAVIAGAVIALGNQLKDVVSIKQENDERQLDYILEVLTEIRNTVDRIADSSEA